MKTDQIWRSRRKRRGQLPHDPQTADRHARISAWPACNTQRSRLDRTRSRSMGRKPAYRPQGGSAPRCGHRVTGARPQRRQACRLRSDRIGCATRLPEAGILTARFTPRILVVTLHRTPYLRPHARGDHAFGRPSQAGTIPNQGGVRADFSMLRSSKALFVTSPAALAVSRRARAPRATRLPPTT
jgi:hypothetical protein